MGLIYGKKHRIEVVEHNHWNTKVIWNLGYVMHRYRRQPRFADFQSPMVNYFKQHLCGGWSMADMRDERTAILDELLERKKPLGIVQFEWNERDAAEDARRRLVGAALVATLDNEDARHHLLNQVFCSQGFKT